MLSKKYLNIKQYKYALYYMTLAINNINKLIYNQCKYVMYCIILYYSPDPLWIPRYIILWYLFTI